MSQISDKRKLAALVKIAAIVERELELDPSNSEEATENDVEAYDKIVEILLTEGLV